MPVGRSGLAGPGSLVLLAGFLGGFRFLRGCFSVTSETDPRSGQGHRPKNRLVFGQVPPTAAKLVDYFFAFLGQREYVLGLRFTPLRGVAAPNLASCCGSGKQCRWRRCGVPRAVCCGNGKLVYGRYDCLEGCAIASESRLQLDGNFARRHAHSVAAQ